MAPTRTPGVFVEENPAFPPSVAQVPTDIPAFVGCTERQPSPNVPVRIASPADYEQQFGGPEVADGQVRVRVAATRAVSVVSVAPVRFVLWHAVRMFFDNGGGAAWVHSAGTYAAPASAADLVAGLERVAGLEEPALLVVPEAALLDAADHRAVVEAMRRQCEVRGDRFAILDVRAATVPPDQAWLRAARADLGTVASGHGAAFWPFLRSTIPFHVPATESNVLVTVDARGGTPAFEGPLGRLRQRHRRIHQAVKVRLATDPAMRVIVPPSGAVAGAIARTDRDRGVWKAPANVPLASVLEPVVALTDAQQASLQVDPAEGKSINAIRGFPGRGTVIWGARTLAGNDDAWRYVPVRRLCTMVAVSIRRSSSWVVFEPNAAATWARLRAMIANFLLQLWRQGGLMGATAKDAFFVHCGLGTTMTPQDVDAGRLNVEIGLAAVRPAEFLVLRLAHQLPAK